MIKEIRISAKGQTQGSGFVKNEAGFITSLFQSYINPQPSPMPRIAPLRRKDQTSEIQIAFIQHQTVYNTNIDNMKATLGHSPTAFKVYMQWYPLFEELKRIVGTRLATLLAWSVSEESQGIIYTAFFRKAINDSGEDPDNLVLSENEQQFIDFGAAVARNNGLITDELFAGIQQQYSAEEVVIIAAFAGKMIAANIFNNLIQTETDEQLLPFVRINQAV